MGDRIEEPAPMPTGGGDAALVNIQIRHTDGSTTEHLNVSPNQVPSLLAAINWVGVHAYTVARVRQFGGGASS